MDKPANPDLNPVKPTDTAPINGNGAAEPPLGSVTWSQWFRANATIIVLVAIALALTIIYLNIGVVTKVAVGLGLVIFIHELGHFLAAKWCDVHVETFSIGFGKAIPGCQFKYGETTYKIGWIPLGGYVKMVGEGENADTEEAEEDPRSFRHKRVGQRMLIISAGVIMNILLACICFIVCYTHGVEERAPVIGWVESGSPAWQEGIHSDVYLIEIDDLKKPVFDDIRPIVMGTDKGETVRFAYKETPNGPAIIAIVEPGRDSEQLYPVVGVFPASQLTLATSRRKEFKPYRIGSPAASAQPPFQGGDKIVACSDPAAPKKDDGKGPREVTPLPADQRDGATGRLDWFVFNRRMQDLRGEPMTITVERDGQSINILLGAAYHQVNGMRMEMGRVAAIRKGSPAANAKAVPDATEDNGIRPSKPDAKEPTGDKIVEVAVQVDSNLERRWVPGETAAVEACSAFAKFVGNRQLDRFIAKIANVIPLDPLRLPFELEQWANGKPTVTKVTMKVQRAAVDKKGTGPLNDKVTLEMDWDDSETVRYSREILTTPNSPISIPGLGLAYYVNTVVEYVVPGSPAYKARLQPGDVVKEIRSKYLTPEKEEKKTKWIKIETYQWAYVFTELQTAEPKEIDLKIDRKGAPIEVTVKSVAADGTLEWLKPGESWPMTDRGLFFKSDTRLHKAQDSLDAVKLGMYRTVRTVRVIYQNLRAMMPFGGRVSPWTMSGPLTIADVSYKIAGEDLWQFILFIGMISVNLAVVNFLPIPVLDGGHMVFLLYEKIRGKPAPESVLAASMYIGLACILALMCFVLFNDVKRLFF